MLSWEQAFTGWVKGDINGSRVSTWTETITRTCQTTGQKAFFLPWGQYVRAAPEMASVKQNGLQLTYGADWNFNARNNTGGFGQPSTADASSGVYLSAGASAGDQIEITWQTGAISLPPPHPIPVRVDSGGLPIVGTKRKWRYATSGFDIQETNGVLFGALPEFQVEIWRRIPKNTGSAYKSTLLAGTFYRGQPRYTPWYRFPLTSAGEVMVEIGDLVNLLGASSGANFSFRACWYEPSTGARSALCSEVLRAFRARDDRLNFGTAHFAGTIYSGK